MSTNPQFRSVIMVSDGGKNSDCFQDHSKLQRLRNLNWEIKSKEDHLTVIELHFTTS